MTRAERGGDTAAGGAGGRGPVLIVGGGIAGLATAAALARLGHEAHVLERAPGFAEIGAGIQLAPNATRILHTLGLLDQVAEGAVFPRRLVLADVRSGATLASLDLGGAFRARYGFPYLVMHRGDLLGILEEACRASGLVTLEACRDVVAVDEAGPGVRARCADGSTYRGGALVGADGLWSQVRPLVSADSPVEAGYVAYRGTLPWDDVAHEMRPDDVIMWIGPQVHFVRYPIRRGELCNQVAVFGSAAYRRGAAEWGTPEELDQAFRGACPPVRHGL
ncbi:MAG TPA: FAD-dependent monooxygenase, partial [Acidimicrobiales bacterium]|nr:FAD-dependent monooxygenase [Acidimicrobiales bacterium]